MPHLALSDLSPALPEILLAGLAMALLIVGAFRGEGSTREVSWLAIAALILVLVVAHLGGGGRRVGFYGVFVTDAFALFMKSLVLAGSAATILMGLRYNEEQKIARFEFPVLVMLATTGMMVMISANDLITLYVGLELQNLALYVTASFDRDSARSSEAGLKYFVLSGLSSGICSTACHSSTALPEPPPLPISHTFLPGMRRSRPASSLALSLSSPAWPSRFGGAVSYVDARCL